MRFPCIFRQFHTRKHKSEDLSSDLFDFICQFFELLEKFPLKGAPCRLSKLEQSEVSKLEEDFGPHNQLPRGSEGKVSRSKAHNSDFMYDAKFDDRVEFEAV